MSAVLFGHPITAQFVLGISIVLISMHQFFTDGDKKNDKGSKPSLSMYASPSMEHVVDVASQYSLPTNGRRPRSNQQDAPT